MNITFWGVRGSIPAPLTPGQIRLKMQAVVQRITPGDLKNADTREQFLLNLPSWLYGTVGGNTACVELTAASGETIILDAGSGIRELGKKFLKQQNSVFHIFISHFHWDHIQGLPFFGPAYNKDSEVHFYSPVPEISRYFDGQMSLPYFPVSMEAFTKNMQFHALDTGATVSIGSLTVSAKKMAHPGGVYAYSFAENGKRFIYATDVELAAGDFTANDENRLFFYGADVLILDSQYTLADAVEKENWGHSAFSHAVDFASFWKIKNIYLFHHEPSYDDKKLYSILRAARWYKDYQEESPLNIHIAVEGQVIHI